MNYLHKVSSGENLTQIGARYEVAPRDILDNNNLTREMVVDGLLLCINKIDGVRHVVKPFESINMISKKFGISSEKIRQFNNISQVFVGEIIYIPNQ